MIRTTDNQGFTVERLTGSIDHRAGYRYDVTAPDGYQFINGTHSLLAENAKAVAAIKGYRLVKCPPGCDCGD